MSVIRFLEPLIEQESNGSPLANSTTPTSLLPLAAKFTLPANFFVLGRELHIRAAGRLSTDGSTPGTVTFDVRLGAVIVFNGGASAALTAGQNIVTWVLDLMLTCRSVGTGATLFSTGRLFTPALPIAVQLLPAATAAPGTGFDSTSAATIDLFATWSALGAGNSIVCYQYSLTAPN